MGKKIFCSNYTLLIGKINQCYLKKNFIEPLKDEFETLKINDYSWFWKRNFYIRKNFNDLLNVISHLFYCKPNIDMKDSNNLINSLLNNQSIVFNEKEIEFN